MGSVVFNHKHSLKYVVHFTKHLDHNAPDIYLGTLMRNSSKQLWFFFQATSQASLYSFQLEEIVEKLNKLNHPCEHPSCDAAHHQGINKDLPCPWKAG